MRNPLRSYGIPLFFLISILGACGGGGGSSEVSNMDFEASEPFNFTVDKESRFRLSLEGVSGKITVSGSPGATSITITGTKRVRSQSIEDAQAHLAFLNINKEELTDEVIVKTDQPQFSNGRSYIVDYTITLPENFEVLVVNFNGAVNINGIVGSALVLVTLFNGEIDAEVTLPLNGKVKFILFNGVIHLAIPTSTSAKFYAEATNGSINLSSNLVFQNVIRSPNPFEGTLGVGDGTVELRIENGDVNVSGF